MTDSLPLVAGSFGGLPKQIERAANGQNGSILSICVQQWSQGTGTNGRRGCLPNSYVFSFIELSRLWKRAYSQKYSQKVV